MPTSDFASLTGSKALVTGSSSGIGHAIALEFASAGADVIVHCRQSRDVVDRIADDLVRQFGQRAIGLAQDLARFDDLPSFVERAWGVWGGIDVWVNNAGVDLLTGPGASLEYSEKLQALWDVDVRGTILLSRLVGERMKSQGTGTIVNIGWDQADRGMEGDSGELFAAAKNAVMGFSRSLAVSLAPEVRVNCIAPGWIRTAWGAQAGEAWQKRVIRETPLARWGEPADVAAVARFLASSAAAYLTGQVIAVNGGAIR